MALFWWAKGRRPLGPLLCDVVAMALSKAGIFAGAPSPPATEEEKAAMAAARTAAEATASYLGVGGRAWAIAKCTAVVAMPLRMRILTRPENLLANFRHQISNKKLLSFAKELASDFARKFASDCECDSIDCATSGGVTDGGGSVPTPVHVGTPGNGELVCLVFVCPVAARRYQAAVWFMST